MNKNWLLISILILILISCKGDGPSETVFITESPIRSTTQFTGAIDTPSGYTPSLVSTTPTKTVGSVTFTPTASLTPTAVLIELPQLTNVLLSVYEIPSAVLEPDYLIPPITTESISNDRIQWCVIECAGLIFRDKYVVHEVELILTRAENPDQIIDLAASYLEGAGEDPLEISDFIKSVNAPEDNTKFLASSKNASYWLSTFSNSTGILMNIVFKPVNSPDAYDYDGSDNALILINLVNTQIAKLIETGFW